MKDYCKNVFKIHRGLRLGSHNATEPISNFLLLYLCENPTICAHHFTMNLAFHNIVAKGNSV